MDNRVMKYVKQKIKPQLIRFYLERDNWKLQISAEPIVDESIIGQISLIVRYRYGEDEITLLPDSVRKNKDEKWIIEITLPVGKLSERLVNGECWDFYVAIPLEALFLINNLKDMESDEPSDAEKVDGFQEYEAEVEENAGFQQMIRMRLKCEKQYQKLELFTYRNLMHNKIFVPYYTAKGRLSFRTEETHIMARLEYAQISRNYLLTLEGFMIIPDPEWLSRYDFEGKVLLVDKNDGQIGEWPVIKVKRHDLTEAAIPSGRNYDLAGFSVSIDLEPIAERFGAIDEPLYLYFRLALLTKNNSAFNLPPVRILSRSKIITGRHIIYAGNGKKSLIVKRNRNHSVVFRIAPYTLIGAAKGKLRRIIKRISQNKVMIRLYHKLFQLLAHLPAEKNLIVFESFFGRQYSCNPRAIYEYMHKHCTGYRMVWSAHPEFTALFDRYEIPYMKRFSVKWLLTMTRANYWVTNVRLPRWMAKPKHTIYLQTWHGTPLKQLALDMEEVHMPGTNTEKYKHNFMLETSRWDYLISPNHYSTKIFTHAFAFHNTMIESGYPRNDLLYDANNQDKIRQIKEKCGLPIDKKVILYAPTWRDNQFYRKGRYKFSLNLDLERMRSALGDEYILLMRLHYLIADHLDLSAYEGFAFDFSHYEDIRELYLVSDLLITDYSSVFFDYANLKRPMIFFTYDIDDYRDHLRGFYFDFEKQAPGPIVKTTDEVVESVRRIEQNHFAVSANFESFYRKFCSMENGHSSARVVNTVFQTERENSRER